MNTKTFIKKYSIPALLLLLLSQGVYAQKEAHNWYFGQHVGMTWNTTQTKVQDGKTLAGLPTQLPPSAMSHQLEGIFGMSDYKGDLLFYSDGMNIWNKNHAVMDNGSGLAGHWSSAQSGIVIPYPGQPYKYIALSVSMNITDVVTGPDYTVTVPGNTLAYSVVDMTENGGLGKVTVNSTKLTGAKGVLGECVAAVRKTDGYGFWIIAAGKGDGANSSLNVWEVTTSGVQTACIASYTLPQNTRSNFTAIANGYLRFSVNGKYFVWPEYLSNNLFFGEFDPATGTFPNIKYMDLGYRGYGVEFNPSGENLYVGSWTSGNTNLHAYKFEDLLASSNPGGISPRIVPTASTATSLGALQLAPDGRIYSPVAGTKSMLVIDNINDYDNFTAHIVDGLLTEGPSNYRAMSGLPNYMAHYFMPVQAGSIGYDQVICTGVIPAVLTSVSEASGGDGVYSYRWQSSTDSVTWNDIAGAAGSGITCSPGALATTTLYRRNTIGTYEGTPFTVSSNVVTIAVVNCTEEVTICSGDKAVLTASLTTPGSVINPVFKWYNAATGGTLLYTGATFTSATTITADTAFYVSIEGDGYCVGPRLKINVTAELCARAGAVDDYKAILVNTPRDTIHILDNDQYPPDCAASVNPVIISGPTVAGASGVMVDKKIVYFPAPGFIGLDSMKYQVVACGDNDIATVYISIIPNPDNIIDTECSVSPPVTAWGIKEIGATSEFLNSTVTPLVGDVDGDGRNEIVAHGKGLLGTTTNKIHIFDDELNLKYSISIPETLVDAIYPLALADVDSDGQVEIFAVTGGIDFGQGTVRALHCYVFNGTTWIEKPGFSNATVYNTSENGIFSEIVIGDINNDGNPEILIYDKVINSRTGNIILTLPAGSRGAFNSNAVFPLLADVDNDGMLEAIAGNMVYKFNKTLTSATIAYQAPAGVDIGDGLTSVADIDLDGYLDVVVTRANGALNGSLAYVWSPYRNRMLGDIMTGSSDNLRISRSFIGDVDRDGRPEIAFSYKFGMVCYKYNPVGDKFEEVWRKPTTDDSGYTIMSMFDFNQDSKNEIIYRDETHLRIINGETGNNLDSFPCYSATAYEYPIVVDLMGSGHAEILVSGASSAAKRATEVSIRRYSSIVPETWAPARSVWNQTAYNAVNVNEDLTIPRYQLNPAATFPGADGVLGTPDDIRPFNNFLQQQTYLDPDGFPFWPAPDVHVDNAASSLSVSGNTLTINACFKNIGDAPIGSPVYVSLYSNTISAANRITTDSANIRVEVDSAACIIITIPDATTVTPDMYQIVVRINDRFGNFAYEAECDSSNNVLLFVNPLIGKKDATLLLPTPLAHPGTYPNPVSVLHGENIEYKITVRNPSPETQRIVVADTLPTYLNYVAASAVGLPTATIDDTGSTSGSPSRTVIKWEFNSVPAGSNAVATVKATPESGSVASQPLFINNAWFKFGNLPWAHTNNTYHQGAGISIMTFSAGFGGNIYNAGEQALDYMTTPRSGIIIVPEEGYAFAGWSHGRYTSLRGAIVEAQEGIMLYDTLTVYGDVELHANFVPEEYDVRYYLNGGSNTKNNPLAYTIESGAIALEAPEKAGDTFVGWTGSNGEAPQQSVVIEKGTTGELTFYANFLHGGREEVESETMVGNDKAWAIKTDLYVRINKAGSVVRVYSLDGVLREQHTIVVPGITTKKLPRGIYIVTINNNAGQKVVLTE